MCYWQYITFREREELRFSVINITEILVTRNLNGYIGNDKQIGMLNSER